MCSLSTAALPRGCLLHTDTGLQWRQWWGRSYWLLSARLREGIAPGAAVGPLECPEHHLVLGNYGRLGKGWKDMQSLRQMRWKSLGGLGFRH